MLQNYNNCDTIFLLQVLVFDKEILSSVGD